MLGGWGILISFWSVLVFSPTLLSLLLLLPYYYCHYCCYYYWLLLLLLEIVSARTAPAFDNYLFMDLY